MAASQPRASSSCAKRSKSAVTNPDYDDSRAPNLHMKFSQPAMGSTTVISAPVSHQKVVGGRIG